MGRKSGPTKPSMRPIAETEGEKLSGAQKRHLIKQWQPKGKIAHGVKHTGGRGRRALTS